MKKLEKTKPLLSKEEIADLLAPLEPEPDQKNGSDQTSSSRQNGHPDQAVESLPTLSLQINTVGQTRLSLKELLQPQTGSLIPLDILSDEILDLYAGNSLLAKVRLVPFANKIGIKVVAVHSEAEGPDKPQ